MGTLGRLGPNSSWENWWGTPSLSNISTTILNGLDIQSVVHGANSVSIIPELLNLDLQAWGPGIWFYQLSMWYLCVLKVEKHCSRENVTCKPERRTQTRATTQLSGARVRDVKERWKRAAGSLGGTSLEIRYNCKFYKRFHSFSKHEPTWCSLILWLEMSHWVYYKLSG